MRKYNHAMTNSAQEDLHTVLIDTSLQIERCKSQNKAVVVERSLRRFGFKSTSSYAKLEFKRAWLRDLAYIYRESECVNRPEELVGRINDKLNRHPANRRRVSRCLQGIEKFLGEVPGHIPYEVALTRFRAHLRVAILGAYTWWDSSVSHEFDGIDCARARTKPLNRHGRIDVSCPRCAPNKVECGLQRFFEEKKRYFLLVSSAIGSRPDASDELKAAKDVIDKACSTPSVLCDDKNCAKLGDILIALDGLQMDCLAANNDKEWRLLAEILRKPLLNPVRDAREAAHK